MFGIEPVELYEDLSVTQDGVFSPSRIDVFNSLTILNRGIINSDFYINDAYRVYVTNSGLVNGTFYVAPDARLVQVVQDNADITDLTVHGNFNVLVRDANDISLTDVFSIASKADKLILDNSTLILNSVMRNNALNNAVPAIEFVGDVVIKLNSDNSINYSVPILRNVSEIGHVHFDVPDMNSLYNALAYVDDGDLYMMRVRETDYGRIFQNDVGNFLNVLRRNIPNDKLLIAMDMASDMDAINSIMRKSVRLHPVKLMTPVRRMHMLDALGGWQYSDLSSINGTTDIMVSNDMLLGRANISMAGSVANNLYAAFGGYVGLFAVSDDINDFTGNLYGANMALHFDDGIIVGNLLGDVARVGFDAGPVFDGNATANNPSGVSGLMAMDVGTYLYREYDVAIVPFAGIITHYESVLNDRDTVAVANFGVELNLSEYDFDILYDYGLRASVLTDGAYHVGVYAKFLSPDDDIGAKTSLEIIHDEFGMGYKISVSANMSF